MDKYEMAQALLIPIWRGIPAAYKSRYRRNIWQQFEDNIRSAAYTASLSKFISHLCSRFQINLKTTDLTAIEGLLHSGRDRELLHLMREESTTLVLMVRVENEQRKEEWARTAEARAVEEQLVSAWLIADDLFEEASTAAESEG